MNNELVDLCRQLKEALEWTSGYEAFNDGGEAYEAWKKIGVPPLERYYRAVREGLFERVGE